MEWADLMKRIAASSALNDAYVAQLPQWVQLWMNFMGLAFLPALVFMWWKVEARWVIAAVVASLIMTEIIGLVWGWNRLWGLSHIVFWLPLLIYLLGRRSVIRWKSVYGAWLALIMMVMAVSLVFDIRDVTLYAMGEPVADYVEMEKVTGPVETPQAGDT